MEEKIKTVVSAEGQAEYELALKKCAETVSQLKSEIKELNQELTLNKVSAEEAKARILQTSQAYEGLTAAVEKLKVKLKSLNDLQIAGNELQKKGVISAKTNAAALEKLQVAVQKIAGDVQILDNSFKSFSQKVNENQPNAEGIQILAEVLKESEIPESIDEIKEVLLDCTDSASHFKSGMEELFLTLPDMTGEAVEEMSQRLLEFSSRMGVVVEETIPALYQAVSQGIPEENVFNFMEAAQKNAAVGMMSLQDSVGMLTTIIKSFNLEAQDAGTVIDQLYAASRVSKTGFDELSQSVSLVAPIAAEVNVSLQDVTAALTAMTLQGVSVSQAASDLKVLLEELGISGNTVSETFIRIAGESFQEFIAEGNSVQDALLLLEQCSIDAGVGLDTLFSSVEAGMAAVSLSGEVAQQVTEAMDAISQSTGDADEAYEGLGDTAELQSQRQEVALENVKTAVGNVLLPAFDEMKAAGDNAFGWATEFIESNPWLVEAFGAVSAGIDTFNQVLTTYETVSTLAKVATDALSGAMETNPVLAVAAGVLGLVSALSFLTSNAEDSTTNLEELTVASDALGERIDAANQKCDDQIHITEETADKARIYTSYLQELEEQMRHNQEAGKDNASQQAEYGAMVDKLNETIPGLNATIDEQTGLLSGGTESILEQCDAWEQLQEQKALEEEFAEVFEAQAEAQLELEANTRSYNDALDEGNRLRKEMASTQQQVADVLGLTVEEIQNMPDVNEWMQNANTEEQQEQIIALSTSYLDLGNQLSENENTAAGWNEALLQNQETLNAQNEKIEEAKEALGSFAEKQNEASSSTLESEQAYANMGDSIDSFKQRMSDLQASYDQSYQKAYSSISGQLGLFNEMKVGTDTTVDGMLNSLDSQIAYMDTYAKNMQTAAKWGVDEGLLKSLSDGSTESAEILQAIVDGGEGRVGELNEKLGSVELGKEQFSDTMAEMETNFTEETDKIDKQMEAFATSLNQEESARASTRASMSGAIQGLEDEYSRFQQYCQQIKQKQDEAFSRSAGSYGPPYKVGLNYVPYDGFKAVLHKGERILTDVQARAQDAQIEIPEYAFGEGETKVIYQHNERTNMAKQIVSALKEMLSGTNIILDDEKVGEFAVRKVTEEVYG